MGKILCPKFDKNTVFKKLLPLYSTSDFTELGLFNIFCFPNTLYEACLDYESKIFQVPFEHVSYAPLSFEYFSLIEN